MRVLLFFVSLLLLSHVTHLVLSQSASSSSSSSIVSPSPSLCGRGQYDFSSYADEIFSTQVWDEHTNTNHTFLLNLCGNFETVTMKSNLLYLCDPHSSLCWISQKYTNYSKLLSLPTNISDTFHKLVNTSVQTIAIYDQITRSTHTQTPQKHHSQHSPIEWEIHDHVTSNSVGTETITLHMEGTNTCENIHHPAASTAATLTNKFQTSLSFQCDERSNGLRFVQRKGCTFFFTFHTPLACPRPRTCEFNGFDFSALQGKTLSTENEFGVFTVAPCSWLQEPTIPTNCFQTASVCWEPNNGANNNSNGNNGHMLDVADATNGINLGTFASDIPHQWSMADTLLSSQTVQLALHPPMDDYLSYCSVDSQYQTNLQFICSPDIQPVLKVIQWNECMFNMTIFTDLACQQIPQLTNVRD